MSKTMRALFIVAPGKVEIREVPKPEPGPGEVLLRVGVVGFCGSDRKTFLGQNAMVEGPRIPGHEIGATIAELGTGVPAKFEVGMKCTVLPYTACMDCPACRQGRFNTCQFNKTMGVQRDGAMCGYIVVPYEKVFTSKKLSLTELALVEPLTVGFHAADRAQVTDADKVLVIGVGAVGLGAIAGAKDRGAEVTALVRSKEKDGVVTAMGADHIVREAAELAYDVVIEASGSGAVISAALNAVSFAGRVAYVGYASGDVTFGNFPKLTQKELYVLGSRNAAPRDFNEVIHSLEAGRLPVERLISRQVTLDEVDQALKEWHSGGQVIRILVNVAA